MKCCTGFNLDSENLLFRQGDAGVSMYVVLRGFVNVYIRNAEQSNDSTELSNADSRCLGTCVANLVVGDSFGELALMRGEPRRIMNGSTRRQYVRTFFGHQTSRRSSPVRSNRGMLVDKTSSELFDSSNFNNGWAGRFG